MRLLLFIFLIFIKTVAYGNSYPAIIPAPVSIQLTDKQFIIDDETNIRFNNEDKELKELADFFSSYVGGISRYTLNHNTNAPKSIRLEIVNESGLGDEGYELNVNSTEISIRANNRKGIFWGMQSIFQTLTPVRTNAALVVPGMQIIDYPRFGWRGMMLDVSRHFFPPETIKQFIDLLASYKLNVFHWHLTDDPGWRIEIKRYPLLTEVGAWRVDRVNTPWPYREPVREGEPSTYGGYYTQDQIRDIVAYAQLRNITIVPEIELPGHSAAALAAYPEFSCTQRPQIVIPGGPYPEGIQTAYCPGNEEVFTFLKNILLEVMDLFPSEFIHIGGDEVEKSRWRNCERCQARIKEEGLADEDELQSYMIRRFDEFLTSHNRRLIGWDEILEGGLAPGATVMSWRGESGGIAAAQMGHDVVMTPGYPLYFDHYQAGPEGEPLAWGGMNTLKNVYDYNPVPSELTEEQGKFILGAQANIWTEFISTVSHLQYMFLPRMLALSEVVWSPAENRNWENFNRRLEGWHFRKFDKTGINYSRGNTRVSITPKSSDGQLKVYLDTEVIDSEIYYTLDGSEPTLQSYKYDGPIKIERSLTLTASAARDRRILGFLPARQDFNIHLAIGREVHYENPVSQRYSADGPNSLTDGVRGTLKLTEHWHGFNGTDMIATIDLGEMKTINRLTLGALQRNRDWIFLPPQVDFEISADGSNWEKWGIAPNPLMSGDDSNQIVDYTVINPSRDTRFVRVTARNFGVCPPGHPGEGHPTWLFVDEIVVD